VPEDAADHQQSHREGQRCQHRDVARLPFARSRLFDKLFGRTSAAARCIPREISAPDRHGRDEHDASKDESGKETQLGERLADAKREGVDGREDRRHRGHADRHAERHLIRKPQATHQCAQQRNESEDFLVHVVRGPAEEKQDRRERQYDQRAIGEARDRVIQEIRNRAGAFDDSQRASGQQHEEHDFRRFDEALRNGFKDAPWSDRIGRHAVVRSRYDQRAARLRIASALETAGRENPGEDGGKDDNRADQEHGIARTLFHAWEPIVTRAVSS